MRYAVVVTDKVSATCFSNRSKNRQSEISDLMSITILQGYRFHMVYMCRWGNPNGTSRLKKPETLGPGRGMLGADRLHFQRGCLEGLIGYPLRDLHFLSNLG